jgi:hypothetical protein
MVMVTANPFCSHSRQNGFCGPRQRNHQMSRHLACLIQIVPLPNPGLHQGAQAGTLGRLMLEAIAQEAEKAALKPGQFNSNSKQSPGGGCAHSHKQKAPVRLEARPGLKFTACVSPITSSPRPHFSDTAGIPPALHDRSGRWLHQKEAARSARLAKARRCTQKSDPRRQLRRQSATPSSPLSVDSTWLLPNTKRHGKAKVPRPRRRCPSEAETWRLPRCCHHGRGLRQDRACRVSITLRIGKPFNTLPQPRLVCRMERE